MKKLMVTKLDKYNYSLSNTEKNYTLNIEFYGISNTEDIETIFMNHNLLNVNYPLSFGLLDDKSGKVIKSKDDEDLIIVVMKDGKKHCLKRLYG